MKNKDLVLLALGSWLFWSWWRKSTGSRFAGLGDVSSDEDLARAAANLVALEGHLESSAAVTSDPKYMDALARVREMRRKAMSKMLPVDAGGDDWCCVKHLLASSSQLCETAAKYLAEGRKDEALQLLQEGKKARDAAIAFAASARPGAQCSVCRGG